jgi:S-formylglutathione hydrolase FrmB
MIYSEIDYLSGSLGMHTRALVLIPQDRSRAVYGKNGDAFRVMYLLHGLSDDETIWMRRTSIERYAEQYGIVVVMPRGDRSFYCDLDTGSRYFEFVSRELPDMVSFSFNVSDRREDTFAAGLSMGGYGALKLALGAPDRFCSAASFSAVTDWPGILKNMFPGLMGSHYDCPPCDDLYYLADNFGNDFPKPDVFIGCGTEDVLLPESRNFRDKLRSLGFKVEYKESAGTHSWEFWDEYIRYALEFFFGRG